MFLALYCLGLVGLLPPGGAATSTPRVEVRLAPGPYLVGQAIAVDVAASGPIRTPDVPDADLIPGSVAVADPKAGSPGRARYYLVPRRAGGLTIPPFRASEGAGSRVAASRPTTIAVGNVPAAGRTAAFLGGVGDFRVAAAVEPATVRVGQSVDFRLTIAGAAAAGSGRIPDLAGWAGLPAGWDVRAATTELVPGDPPTRTCRYRLRPTTAGRATLPPIGVAAFDPRSGRYATRYTPSLVVEVAEPPRFDPAEVDYPPADRSPSPPDRWLAIVKILAVLGLAGTGGLVVGRRAATRRRTRRVDWRREATRLRRIDAGQDQKDLADEIAGRLAANLARALGRPLAALTPPEAEAAVRAIAAEEGWARRTGMLIATCDRFRFDPATAATAGDRGELVAEAVAIFEGLGRQARRGDVQPTRSLRAGHQDRT